MEYTRRCIAPTYKLAALFVLIGLAGACERRQTEAKDGAIIMKPVAVTETPVGVTVSEDMFRKNATTRPVPVYPRVSMESGVGGVAVASIRCGLDGRPESVEILEAPDSHIAASVRDALQQWIVPPVQVVGAPGKSKQRARLTFYFRIQNNKGIVLTPEDMGPADSGHGRAGT